MARKAPPSRHLTSVMHIRSFVRATRPVALTALVDVVFILLFFFMLASSYLDWRSMRLGVSGAAAGGAGEVGSVHVRVGPGGDAIVGSHRLSAAGLVSWLAEQGEGYRARPFIVEPVAAANVQDVVDVMDALAVGGVATVSLLSQ